jgi:hypothetical protein
MWPKFAVEYIALLIRIRRHQLQISLLRPVFLTEEFRDSLHSLQINIRKGRSGQWPFSSITSPIHHSPLLLSFVVVQCQLLTIRKCSCCIFLVMTLYSVVGGYQTCRRTYCIHVEVKKIAVWCYTPWSTWLEKENRNLSFSRIARKWHGRIERQN